MTIRTILSEKSAQLVNLNDYSWKLLFKIKNQFIREQAKKVLGIEIVGMFTPISITGFKEIMVADGSFTLMSASKQNNYAFSVHTNQDNNLMHIGITYKHDVIAPHMRGAIEDILDRYEENELNEILTLINEAIENLSGVVKWMEAHTSSTDYSCYFMDYNKGFDSENTYQDMEEIFQKFKLSPD